MQHDSGWQIDPTRGDVRRGLTWYKRVIAGANLTEDWLRTWVAFPGQTMQVKEASSGHFTLESLSDSSG